MTSLGIVTGFTLLRNMSGRWWIKQAVMLARLHYRHSNDLFTLGKVLPLFSPHYMFFHNMLSGTQCTQCCCDYVWNGFISSLLISILGITYGFSVMLCNESPNIPFTVFRMRFSQGRLNLMCVCMLWPLIRCCCVWRKILFVLPGVGYITIQWIALYVITTLKGD